MATAFKCPNCGSTSRKQKSETETEYECLHCGTDFIDNQAQISSEKLQEELNRAMKNNAHAAQASYFNSAKKTQRVVLLVTLTLVLAGIGFGVYMSQKAMKDAEKRRQDILKMQQEMIKEIKSSN